MQGSDERAALKFLDAYRATFATMWPHSFAQLAHVTSRAQLSNLQEVRFGAREAEGAGG